ncbi:MAG: TolC family protein [Thermodesulfobacteriota bacterium]
MFRFFCFILTSILVLFPASAVSSQNGTLTLQQAFRTALDENSQVQVSAEKYQQLQDDVDTATSNLYPQLSVEGQYVRQKETKSSGQAIMPSSTKGPKDSLQVSDLRTTSSTINPSDYMGYTLQLEQHIYQLGKVWSGRSMAKHEAMAAKFEHYRNRQQILLQVARRYYEVLLARRQIEIAENMKKRAKKQLEQAESMLEVGKVTETAVLRAKVQVADAKEQLERAGNKYDVARENLSLEMGVSDLKNLDIKEPPKKELQAEAKESLFKRALSNRRDLKQARERLQSVQERVDWEQADFFPRIAARGEYSGRNEPASGGEKESWQAALVVSYPLFTGGKRGAQMEKAYSQVRQARSSMRRLKKEIRVDVRSAYLDVKTQHKVIKHLKDSVDSAKANYEQVVNQFKAGLASSVDQTEAFTTLNETESSLASAYYQYQLDLFRLKSATGILGKDFL